MTVLGSQRNQGEGSTVFSLLYGFPFALQFCEAELRIAVFGGVCGIEAKVLLFFHCYADFHFILHFFFIKFVKNFRFL